MNRRLRFLSAAMSSRPSYPLGRSHPRRSFSSSNRPNAAAESAGDPQFRLHGQTGGSDFHRSLPSAPPHFNPNPNLRHPPPPHFNQNPNFRHPPPPHYQRNQQFRPPPPSPQFRRPPPQFRPKPPDYRTWDFSKTTPSTTTDRFTVLSYNILADNLALDHRNKLYYHIPRHMLDWQWRKRNILFELGLWSTDIMCFQEVDRFQDLEEELKRRGYKGIWKMRTGEPVDGCAMFWRASRFKLLYEESIEFNKFGLRDNVAQVCVLELMKQSSGNSASPGSAGSDKVVICNIHVLFNPKRGDIKLGQVRILLEKAHAASKNWNDAPVVLCGDFNCVPKSPLYNYISEQKLDLSGIDRDKVSGQASAEIHIPRLYGTSSGSGENVVPAPSRVQCTGVDMQKSSLDTPKSDNSNSNAENVLSEGNISGPESSNAENTYQRVSEVKDADDEGKLDEVKEETQQSSLDNPGDRSRSACCVSGSEFREDKNTSHGKGGSSPSVTSHPEVVFSAEIACAEINHNENTGSFDDSSDTNNSLQKESVTSDTLFPSLPEISHSIKNDDSDHWPQKFFSDDQGGFSGPSQADLSSTSTSIEAEVKTDGFSQTEFDGEVMEGSNVAEDITTFLSALHNDGGASPLHSSSSVGDLSSDLVDDPLDKQQNFSDPSLWAPGEMETATGSADCTTLEHPLKLKSTYTEAEDTLGIRDSNGEPLVTSYHKRFLGTVDYIWRSEGLQTVRVLAPIPKHVMEASSGFPTRKWGSDHIALATELAFAGDQTKS